MIICCRLTHTGYTELMRLSFDELRMFENALANVLERERSMREED